MNISDELIVYMKKEIEANKGMNEERIQLRKLFNSHEELLDATLFFYREMFKRGVMLSRFTKKLKDLGVDTDKLIGDNYMKPMIMGELPDGMQKIIKHQLDIKSGNKKIAYKSGASIEKCVELYTKYQNINRVVEKLEAEGVKVSHMTVRRRLKEADI